MHRKARNDADVSVIEHWGGEVAPRLGETSSRVVVGNGITITIQCEFRASLGLHTRRLLVNLKARTKSLPYIGLVNVRILSC